MQLRYHFLKFHVILWSLPVVFIYLSQAELFKAFKELFTAATSRPPPYGICPYPSSRAIYAVDLMLKWSTGQNGEGLLRSFQCSMRSAVILITKCTNRLVWPWILVHLRFQFFTTYNYAIIPRETFFILSDRVWGGEVWGKNEFNPFYKKKCGKMEVLSTFFWLYFVISIWSFFCPRQARSCNHRSWSWTSVQTVNGPAATTQPSTITCSKHCSWISRKTVLLQRLHNQRHFTNSNCCNFSPFFPQLL